CRLAGNLPGLGSSRGFLGSGRDILRGSRGVLGSLFRRRRFFARRPGLRFLSRRGYLFRSGLFRKSLGLGLERGVFRGGGRLRQIGRGIVDQRRDLLIARRCLGHGRLFRRRGGLLAGGLIVWRGLLRRGRVLRGAGLLF